MRAAHPEAGYPGSTPIGRTPRAVRKVIAVTLTLTTAVACGRKAGLTVWLAGHKRKECTTTPPLR